jgi:hypothetical protein
MSVQRNIEITSDLNDNDIATLDVGGWDFAEVQLVSPTGTFSFFTSNDSGAITGVSDGNNVTATNFTAVTGTKLSDASAVTTLAGSGIVKFSNLGQYLRITGAGAAQVTKGFVRLYKIH